MRAVVRRQCCELSGIDWDGILVLSLYRPEYTELIHYMCTYCLYRPVQTLPVTKMTYKVLQLNWVWQRRESVLFEVVQTRCKLVNVSRNLICVAFVHLSGSIVLWDISHLLMIAHTYYMSHSLCGQSVFH